MADIRVYPFYSPRIVEVLAPATEISVQELHNKLRDWEDSDENTFDEIISSAGKEPLGGGVYVGVTSTLLNAKVMFTGRCDHKETGTCTTADSTGTRLIASGGQFVTNGLVAGDTVHNDTADTFATIVEIVSETELISFPLDGTGRKTWEIGDEYSVFHNVVCSITGGNLVAVDDGGNEMECILPSPYVQIVRSSASSATLQEVNVGSIAAAVWDVDRIEHTGVGSFGATDEWAGQVDVSAIATASATAVWDEARSGHTDPGSFGNTSEWAGEVDVDAIADAIWDEEMADHLAPGTTGEKLSTGGTGDPVAIADAVWDETLSGHLDPGTTGEKLSTGGSGDPGTIAAAVWNALREDYGTPGTMGWLQNLLDSGIINKPKVIPGE